MLTLENYLSRLKRLIDNAQIHVREQFSSDLKTLEQNNINSYDNLLDAVRSDNLPIEVRTIACWLCGKLGDSDSMYPLLFAAQSNSSQIRHQAILSVSELQLSSQEVIKMLVNTLNDNDLEVRKASIYALGSIKAPQTLSSIIAVILNNNEPTSLRGIGIEALINFNEPLIIPLLIDQLDDQSIEVRFWSVFALGQLGAKEALPKLQRLVAENNNDDGLEQQNVRQEATEAIKLINQAHNASDFQE